MVISDVKIALQPCYDHLSTAKVYIFCNGYQSLTIIIAKIIDGGWYNVGLEEMFTTLTIIALVPYRVLATHR